MRALVVLAVLAAPAAASGQRVDVRGDCPGAAQVRGALAREGTPIAALGLTVRVRSRAGQARMVVFDRAGRQLARRSVDSDDCEAIADAFALIASESARRASVAGGLEALPIDAPDLRAAPAPEAQEPARPATSTSASRSVRAVGISGGVDAPVAQDGAAGFAQLDLTIIPRRWGARAVVAGTGVSRQAATMDAIERRSLAVRVEAARRFDRDALWWQPALGAGAVVSRTEAVDLPDRPRIVRAHPLVGGSLSGGVRLDDRLSVRAELAAALYPISDSYVIDPAGEVGRSPRASVSVGLGLVLDTGW